MRSGLTAVAALTAALAALLSACASQNSTVSAPTAPGAAAAPAASEPTGTSAQQQALARYQAYAGPPLQYFTWFGHYDSWEALGKDRLVIYTTPSDAYLLKIWPPCDLRFVINRIGISSTSSSVYTRFDSVLVSSGPGSPPLRCPIDEIRKVDVPRMRADARAQKAGAAVAQPGAPDNPPPPPPNPQR
jgi:hypothetical protein